MAATEPGRGRDAAAPADANALPPVEEVLAREAERSPRAGYAALLAALLVMAGGIALQAIYADIPRVELLDALRDAAGQGIGRAGLLTDKVRFYDDKAIPLIVVSLLQAVGAICTGYVLVFLYDATTARGGKVPRLARLAAVFGAASTAIGYVALQIVAAILSHDFATGRDQSTKAAHDALRSGVLVVAQFLGFFGTLVLAVAFVMIALNAMRVGLFTRFMGILGILVGILLIVPIGSPVPIVQAFWLAAAGVLFLGRWPRGAPPAWQSGRAMPWPSQQQVREARSRARGGGGPAAPREAASSGAAAGSEEPRPGEPSPATSRKKKRKRRP